MLALFVGCTTDKYVVPAPSASAPVDRHKAQRDAWLEKYPDAPEGLKKLVASAQVDPFHEPTFWQLDHGAGRDFDIHLETFETLGARMDWWRANTNAPADIRDRVLHGRVRPAGANRLIEMRRTREAYLAEHPDLDPQIRRMISEDSFGLGMSAEQVLLVLPKPDKINRTVSAGGVSEQWVYTGRYLYFDNGILRSWQD